MPVFVITGANRGIGLGYVKELSRASDNVVFAVVRKPQTAEALNEVAAKGSAQVHIVEGDVSDHESIAHLPAAIKEVLPSGTYVDILINNEAVLKDSHLKTTTLTQESLSEHLTANVLGPARVLAALLPLLAKGAVVANITSGLGSNEMLFSERITAQNISYSLSKATLNMLTIHQAKELQGRVVVVAIDPGHVKTDMGGDAATMEVASSSQAVLQTLKKLDDQQSGRFLLFDGTVLPW